MRGIKIAVVFVLLFQFTIGCADDKVWYRGNTHAHTLICGHADSTPEVVAKWYLDNGYNFLILSEHNHFINPDSVQLPENRREDFILIPGEEITGPKVIHSTAMNIKNIVSSQPDLEIKSQIIQNHVDVTLGAGGNAILNHPNYYYTIRATDIFPVKNLYMFELFNGHPHVNNSGNSEHPSTEDLWDELLTKGMRIYGVSSDDAHHFSKIDTIYSNPGRGWVMVLASQLSSNAISQAMINGDFYASNGIFLSKCSVINGIYRVEVDQEKTHKELALSNLYGKRINEKQSGFSIEFIGPEGKVLSATNTNKADFKINGTQAYVRVKVSFRRMHPKRGMEEYNAWGQPVFTDGRENGSDISSFNKE